MIDRCPKTARLLKESVSDILTGLPMSYCFFSTLGPKSKIAPHFGPCNLRLRCHVPLQVPSTHNETSDYDKLCRLRVGNDWVAWKNGETILFDDCYEHEAENRHPTESRVVLLFDIWHPQITLEERTAFVDMFNRV